MKRSRIVTIKADYDMIADCGLLGYGAVTKGAEASE